MSNSEIQEHGVELQSEVINLCLYIASGFSKSERQSQNCDPKTFKRLFGDYDFMALSLEEIGPDYICDMIEDYRFSSEFIKQYMGDDDARNDELRDMLREWSDFYGATGKLYAMVWGDAVKRHGEAALISDLEG